jgi:hypothetical protein
MAKRSGMYSSTKRKKELNRKKKQEEKKLKRQKSAKDPSQDIEAAESAHTEQEAAEDTPSTTDQ